MRSRMFIDILIGKKNENTYPQKNASEIVTTE